VPVTRATKAGQWPDAAWIVGGPSELSKSRQDLLHCNSRNRERLGRVIFSRPGRHDGTGKVPL